MSFIDLIKRTASPADKFLYDETSKYVKSNAPKALNQFVFKRYRLSTEHVIRLMEMVQKDGKCFVINETVSERASMMGLFNAFCIWKGIPFYINVSERLLRAGMSGVDLIAEITVFRPWHDKLIVALKEIKVNNTIPIYIADVWSHHKIGLLDANNKDISIYNGREVVALLEKDIEEIKNDLSCKTGALLWGPPGTGKSYVARYLSIKHELPIYAIVLTPEINNQNVIRMFSEFQKPAILLIEDFDSYFNERVPIDKKAQYTFDAFLNSLDGTYSSLNGMIVIMTANNVDKIDTAIKNRPSRLKYVRKMDNPTQDICDEIFCDDKEWSNTFYGSSLDVLLFCRDLRDHGRTVAEAQKEVAHMQESIAKAVAVTKKKTKKRKRKNKKSNKAITK